MAESEDKPGKPPDRSRRAVILATVGIVVIMGVAVCAVRVVPVWQTHQILQNVRPHKPTHAFFFGVRRRYKTIEDAMERLGGPDQATKRLSLYLRLPKWIAPRKEEAICLLAKCGESAVPALEKAVGDDDVDIRRGAMLALSYIGPKAKAAVPALVKALSDTDVDVRRLSAEALAYIGPEAKEAVPALAKALGDSDVIVRKCAAWALGYIGPEAKAAVPALIEALSEKDASLRQIAARALGKIGPGAKTAVPMLKRLLKDENEVVRQAAAEALKKIRGEGEEGAQE